MKRLIVLLALLAVLGGCIILHHRENSPDNRNAPVCKVNCN